MRLFTSGPGDHAQSVPPANWLSPRFIQTTNQSPQKLPRLCSISTTGLMEQRFLGALPTVSSFSHLPSPPILLSKACSVLLMPIHFYVLNHHGETMNSEPLSPAGFWCLLNVQYPKSLSHTIWVKRRSIVPKDPQHQELDPSCGVPGMALTLSCTSRPLTYF